MLDPNKALSDLAKDASISLKATFGVDPTLHAAAPGRVNLIGEHIDYCDGFVLPLAIVAGASILLLVVSSIKLAKSQSRIHKLEDPSN